jgi:uncharacterized coiled-coil protein SlyX
MTSHIKAREFCRRLRELEIAVSEQRKIVGALEARKLDTADERALLARLLEELDAALAQTDAEKRVA